MIKTRNLAQRQAISIYSTILLLCNISPVEIAEHVILFAPRSKGISQKELSEALRRLLLTEAIQNIDHVRNMRK